MLMIRYLLPLFLAISHSQLHAASAKSENVFLITTDGLRWEEVFQGADESLFNKQYGNISKTNEVRQAFWRPAEAERRELLMPFLWGTVAKQGQLWGNRTKQSDVRVSNGRNFSYPGYNEFLSGIADPKIDSNDKVLNANTNVFEWLNLRGSFRDRVAAVINWDVLPWILNAPRAGFPVWSGFEVPPGTKRLAMPEALASLVEHGKTPWEGVLLDTFVRYAAFHAVRTFKPAAMYVAYGETDDWAHEGAYERYLKSAQGFDRFLGDLWREVQSTPQYAGRTTFVITTDHGRGPVPIAWKDHGREMTASAYMWLAVIGPDTPPLGERADTPLVTQAQIAATVAAAVGQKFDAGGSRRAPPISGVFK